MPETDNKAARQAEYNLGRTGVTSGERAQVLASLAVAHEQRTANLLAYLAAASNNDLPYQPSPSVLKSVQAEVEERLGLV